MTWFEPGLFAAVRSSQPSQRGTPAFVLALLLAGCTSGSATTPTDDTVGTAGQVETGTAGTDGDVGNPAVGGAGGIAPSMGARGQAGGPGTMSIETCAGVVPTGVGVPAGTVVTARAAVVFVFV